MLDLGLRYADRQLGSNSEPFTMVLRHPDFAPINLTGATVTFSLRNRDTNTLKVDNAAATGTSAGVASYAPTPADLDTAGNYQGQFLATWAGNEVYGSPLFDVRILPNV